MELIVKFETVELTVEFAILLFELVDEFNIGAPLFADTDWLFRFVELEI